MIGITLKEVMKTEPFSKAILVAGRNGLDRTVFSATIQEVPEVAKWMRGGEIVFTAGYAFRTPEKGVLLLKALAEKKYQRLL